MKRGSSADIILKRGGFCTQRTTFPEVTSNCDWCRGQVRTLPDKVPLPRAARKWVQRLPKAYTSPEDVRAKAISLPLTLNF